MADEYQEPVEGTTSDDNGEPITEGDAYEDSAEGTSSEPNVEE